MGETFSRVFRTLQDLDARHGYVRRPRSRHTEPQRNPNPVATSAAVTMTPMVTAPVAPALVEPAPVLSAGAVSPLDAVTAPWSDAAGPDLAAPDAGAHLELPPMDLSQLELPRLDLAPFDPAALGATQPEATLPEATLPEATAEPAPRPTFRVLSPEELHPGDYYAPVVRADKIHPPDKPERPSAPRGDYVNRLRTRRTTPHNP